MARHKKVIEMSDNDIEFEEISVLPKKRGRKKKEKSEFDDTKDILITDETDIEQPEEQDRIESESIMQRKAIEIRQVSIKDDLFCSYAWDNYSNNEFVGPSKHSNLFPIHTDLRDSFEKLNVHLASIFENDITKANQVKVLAFKIEGKPLPVGVIFSGYKVLSSGEHGKVETPLTKFNGNYINAEEMHEDILTCISEVEKYHSGKHAPILVQQSFDFDKEETDDINKTIEGKKETLDGDDLIHGPAPTSSVFVKGEAHGFTDEMKEQILNRRDRNNQLLAETIELEDDEPADVDPFAVAPGFSTDIKDEDF